MALFFFPPHGENENIQWPNKLHPPNLPEQIHRRSDRLAVTDLQPQPEIHICDLDVRAIPQAVHLAHQPVGVDRKRRREIQHALEEHHELVGGEALDVVGGRGEAARTVHREGLPPISQRVDDVDEGGVKVRLGRQARRVEPFVPVDGGQRGRGGGVVGEEVEKDGFELVGVEGLAFEFGEVLDISAGCPKLTFRNE